MLIYIFQVQHTIKKKNNSLIITEIAFSVIVWVIPNRSDYNQHNQYLYWKDIEMDKDLLSFPWWGYFSCISKSIN